MNLSELKERVVKLGSEYPHLKDKIYEAYRWCVGEIVDGGGSESHEIQLCLSDIGDIIREDEEGLPDPPEPCYE